MKGDRELELGETVPETRGARETQAAPAPRLCLVLYHCDGTQTIPLEPDSEITIGRGEDVDVSVRDRNLSRRHARFERIGDEVWVEDLGSTNGTQLNGETVERALIGLDDQVLFGAVSASLYSRSPLEVRPTGLESHDRFRELLEDEIDRCRNFGRSLAFVVVRSTEKEKGRVGSWYVKLQPLLRRFDRLALYSPDTLEILLPEASLEETAKLAGRLLDSAPDDKLVCGVGVFPESATSAEELLEVVHGAAGRANARYPVTLAASLASRAIQAEPPTKGPIVRSDLMREVYATVERLARSKIPVLLQGETGSGKELIAAALHRRGPRAKGPMRCVNCGAIVPNLVESTLFGHERGAFTGAQERSDGVFLSADGGTVFLDEVGELPLAAQAALLRVLETKRVCRVGSTKEIETDVRIVAATHRDLEEMCETGAFRSDLLYRLNAVTLRVPPLRERPEEIEPLARHFLKIAVEANDSTPKDISPEAMVLLERYSWPGNVRELRNAIERAVVIAPEAVLSAEDLPERVRGHTGSRKVSNSEDSDIPLKKRVREYEAHLILDTLLKCHWDRNEAARMLGMPLRTLTHRMSVLGIKKPSGDGDA